MAKVNDLVVHCIDFRFRAQEAAWIESNLNGRADLVAIAGVSKAILDADTHEAVFKQLDIAQRLHGVTTIHLLDHIDCGAYGGSKEHADKEAEVAMHKEKLAEATKVITERFPALTVKSYIVDHNDISEL